MDPWQKLSHCMNSIQSLNVGRLSALIWMWVNISECETHIANCLLSLVTYLEPTHFCLRISRNVNSFTILNGERNIRQQYYLIKKRLILLIQCLDLIFSSHATSDKTQEKQSSYQWSDHVRERTVLSLRCWANGNCESVRTYKYARLCVYMYMLPI
jgi:hypothetical protein